MKETIEEITSQFVKGEQEIEDNYWNGIGDVIQLNKDDLEFHQESVEDLLERHLHLPQILYKSMIVSIYSLLETTLHDVIKSIENSIPKKIKLKHLRTKGSEIENLIHFLELVHNIEFKNLIGNIRDLKPYADLRNNIVHKNGHLKNESEQRKKSIEVLASKSSSIEIRDDELYFKNNLVLYRFLKIVNDFGFKFFAIIENKDKQH